MFRQLFTYGFLTRKERDPSTGSLPSPPTANTVDYLKIKVFPDWLKSVTLSWEYPSWLEAKYANVYRSESPNGPWTLINLVPLTDRNWYRDEYQHTSSKFNQDYYLVELYLTDGSSVCSEIGTWDVRVKGREGILADEIQRREWLLLRKFTGIQTAVFPRKNYGTRCPDCWDPIAKKVTNDHCKSCFGSGFLKGFWNPIQTYIQYEPTPNAMAKTYFGRFEQNDMSAWTICDPQINPDDILVRLEDFKVYEVVGSNNTELRGRRVRQMMHITELARADIEYSLVSKVLNGDYSEWLTNEVQKPKEAV